MRAILCCGPVREDAETVRRMIGSHGQVGNVPQAAPVVERILWAIDCLGPRWNPVRGQEAAQTLAFTLGLEVESVPTEDVVRQLRAEAERVIRDWAGDSVTHWVATLRDAALQADRHATLFPSAAFVVCVRDPLRSLEIADEEDLPGSLVVRTRALRRVVERSLEAAGRYRSVVVRMEDLDARPRAEADRILACVGVGGRDEFDGAASYRGGFGRAALTRPSALPGELRDCLDAVRDLLPEPSG